MSPWVATTRLSLVATITLQPVPQKRHAGGRCRNRGGLELEHLAAIEFWRSWVFSRHHALAGIDGVKDKGSCVHISEPRDGAERRAKRARIRRIYHDDELASW